MTHRIAKASYLAALASTTKREMLYDTVPSAFSRESNNENVASVTTPGNFVDGQEPVMSAIGLFTVKDIVLLAASFVLLAQSLVIRRRSHN